MCWQIWICLIVSSLSTRAYCKEALDQVIVNHNALNVTVGVPRSGNITIKWLTKQPQVTRVVMAIANASNPVAKLKDGDFQCYKDGVFPQEECKAHFSLSGNPSGDIVISMRNLPEEYFECYLISVYSGPNSKITTLWIKVEKKEGTAMPVSSATPSTGTILTNATPSTGVTSQDNKNGYKPPATEATTSGTGTKNWVVIGVSIGVTVAAILIGGCSLYWCCKCYHKRHRRLSDAKKIVEPSISTEERVELGGIINDCASPS